MTDAPNEQRELIALRKLSVRLARNPLLVQASTGNISIKIGDSLWIKASGKWLAQAEADDFLVTVGLARAKRCVRDGLAIPETEATSAGAPGASIETAMHAVLPHRVVIHVHSVNTITWAIREDGPRQLGTRLGGLPWRWIPYTPSGNALAKEIDNVLSCFPQTHVLILANHGLVVCGDCCRTAALLLSDVERRLAIEPRSASKFDFAQLARKLPNSRWFVPRSTAIHALARDHISRRILAGGVLYPCQAIFLAETVPMAASPLAQEVAAGRWAHGGKRTFLVLEHQGVLCNKHIAPAEQELLFGLANIVQRIDASATLRYLSDSEVEEVLHGQLQHYRRVATPDCRERTERVAI